MGSGSIGGLGVMNGGIVAPGNSIGTMSVAGNVNFVAGSVYQVEANAAGQSDRIIASGTATLGGGAVQVLAENGTYGRQTRYTILTAGGGVSGRFSNVTSNLAFLTPTLLYDPNNVFLALTRNDVPVASVAQTPNQRSVAGALDRSSPLSALMQTVFGLSDTAAPLAFDALSGEIHGSAQASMIDDARYIRQAVLGRLRQAPYLGESGAMAALGSGGPMLADAGSSLDSALAYAGTKSPNFPVKAPRAATRLPEYTLWAQGVGAWGRVDSDGNAAETRRNLAGIFSGFDRRFGNWYTGLAAGYTNASVKVDGRASSATVDTAHVAGYLGTSVAAWNFRSGAAYAWNRLDTNRFIAIPGLTERATASYDAGTTQVFGEVGYGMRFGASAVEPFAGLAWVHLDTRSFNEAGGISALNGASNKEDVGYSTLGARVATSYALGGDMTLTARMSAAWQHAFGDVVPAAALAFQNTGAAFGIAGIPIARETALVEVGGDLQITPRAELRLVLCGPIREPRAGSFSQGKF